MTASKAFASFSTSSVDLGNGVMSGRPYGGLSMLWHRKYAPVCQVFTFDDRIIGPTFSLKIIKYLFLYVYLPYFSKENYLDYVMYANGVMVIGDLKR